MNFKLKIPYFKVEIVTNKMKLKLSDHNIFKIYNRMRSQDYFKEQYLLISRKYDNK